MWCTTYQNAIPPKRVKYGKSCNKKKVTLTVYNRRFGVIKLPSEANQKGRIDSTYK